MLQDCMDVLTLLVLGHLCGQVPDLMIDGIVPEDALPYFEVGFDVPEGVVEMRISRVETSSTNILDWGLLDAAGTFVGWGGGNSEDIIVGAEAASRSYLAHALTPGRWSLLIGQARIDETPARYSTDVFFNDVVSLAPDTDRRPFDYGRVPSSAPGPAAGETTRWFAGDFHVHSEQSGDANASLDTIASFGLEQGLDFVVVTDHNTSSHFTQLAAAMDRNPAFLFIPGIEVTTYRGHLGLIGAKAWVDFRLQASRSLGDLFAEAQAQGALLSINHPVLDLGESCIGCPFLLEGDLTGLAGVEIQTGANRLFTAGALAFWDDLFAPSSTTTGPFPAALGGSDDHRAGQDLGLGQSPIGRPTTMVEATALSADAILAGVRGGRTVVKLTGAAGPMVELDAPGRSESLVQMRVRESSTAANATVVVTAKVSGGSGHTLLWIVDGNLDTAVEIQNDPQIITFNMSAEGRIRAELWLGEEPVTITSHLLVSVANQADEDPPLFCTCQNPRSGLGGGLGGRLGVGAALALAFSLGRRRVQTAQGPGPHAGPICS